MGTQPGSRGEGVSIIQHRKPQIDPHVALVTMKIHMLGKHFAPRLRPALPSPSLSPPFANPSLQVYKVCAVKWQCEACHLYQSADVSLVSGGPAQFRGESAPPKKKKYHPTTPAPATIQTSEGTTCIQCTTQ